MTSEASLSHAFEGTVTVFKYDEELLSESNRVHGRSKIVKRYKSWA